MEIVGDLERVFAASVSTGFQTARTFRASNVVIWCKRFAVRFATARLA